MQKSKEVIFLSFVGGFVSVIILKCKTIQKQPITEFRIEIINRGET